jgi:hypothetical protein
MLVKRPVELRPIADRSSFAGRMEPASGAELDLAVIRAAPFFQPIAGMRTRV